MRSICQCNHAAIRSQLSVAISLTYASSSATTSTTLTAQNPTGMTSSTSTGYVGLLVHVMAAYADAEQHPFEVGASGFSSFEEIQMIAYTSRPSAYASSHFSWTFADVRKSALILSTSSQSDLHRIIRMVNSCLTFDTGVKKWVWDASRIPTTAAYVMASNQHRRDSSSHFQLYVFQLCVICQGLRS